MLTSAVLKPPHILRFSSPYNSRLLSEEMTYSQEDDAHSKMDIPTPKAGITSLPLELFQSLVDAMIVAVGLHSTTSLRLVNKFFNEEVLQSVFRRGYLKPKTGRYDQRIPRNLYIKYILWRLKSPRGRRSHINAALNASIDCYNERFASKSAIALLGEELLPILVQSTADHVSMKRLRLTPQKGPVNIRRIQQGALVLAVSLEDIASVKLILNEDAHANYGTVHLARPLVAACRTGQKEMVELLLENGAKISGTKTNLQGERTMAVSPLQSACQAGHEHIVQLLLDRAESDPDFDIDLEGIYAIQSCIEGRHNDLFKLVYSKTWGASFDAMTAAGYLGNIEIVNMLLDEIDPNTYLRTGQERRCLSLAARNGRVPLVKELLKRDAYGGFQTENLAFHLAVAYRRYEVVELLLETGGPINTSFNITEVYEGHDRTLHGTPLITAAENNDCRMMQILIDHGVDLSSQRQGESALKRAKAHSCSDAVKFLLDIGVRLKERKKTKKNKVVLDTSLVDEFSTMDIDYLASSNDSETQVS